MAKVVYINEGTGDMDRWIDAGKSLYLSNEAFCLKERINNDIIIIKESLIFRYISLLDKYTVNVKLTSDEFIKYRYQPKLFCIDFYGTPELWSALLKINHMTSVLEFNKTILRAFTANVITALEEILTLEEEELSNNKKDIKK